ncbi:hypothetical protein EJ377_18730 [Chryseobacterium arthrosphaerae]|uniref:Uncharacterized protein n=1 Tax=Chryseobacterium arthrosphaerae TaxID=651561 RepID=A0A3S0NL75_9FLAO|nr:hypothetical protein EJ377_18730 [Chryseobacterium arthrosphaerae]
MFFNNKKSYFYASKNIYEIKINFRTRLTVAALYLNAQQHPKGKENPDTKVNKKYLKHIQDITTAYQKNVKFAREHHQKPPDEYYLQDFIATMDLKQEQ